MRAGQWDRLERAVPPDVGDLFEDAAAPPTAAPVASAEPKSDAPAAPALPPPAPKPAPAAPTPPAAAANPSTYMQQIARLRQQRR
jgi:hypothetical protein